LELIKLSKKKDRGGSTSDAMMQRCQLQLQCANGGTLVNNGDSCQCVCVNGFSGDRCTVPANSGCATLNTSSDATLQNAILGSAIPRLLENANKNFSVPLDSAKLLSLFSSTNLSCTSQNALVTFDGQASHVLQDSVHPTITNAPIKRTNPSGLDPSNIITVSESFTYTIPDTTSSQATPSASSAANASGQGAPKILVVNDTVLDFARASVLFILQNTSSLEAAITAQGRLQNAFSSAKSLSNVNVGNNITVEFGCDTIDLGGGKKVGSGKGSC
jgi:hypothetical protein